MKFKYALSFRPETEKDVLFSYGGPAGYRNRMNPMAPIDALISLSILTGYNPESYIDKNEHGLDAVSTVYENGGMPKNIIELRDGVDIPFKVRKMAGKFLFIELVKEDFQEEASV